MAHPTTTELAVGSADQEYVTIETNELLKLLISSLDPELTTAPARVVQRTPEGVDEIIFEADIAGVRYYLARSQPTPPARVSLSPRELAIARLIAKGLPNKCIGDILEISQWTVATHLRRMFVKLGVTTRAAMVARLVEENLL